MTEINCFYNRHSIRLKGYDYALPGDYFITICTYNRKHLYGEIVGGEMWLNEMGEMVNFTWFDLVNHVENIELGPFVIMPNHIHGVIQIVGAGVDGARAGLEPAPTAHTKPTTNGAVDSRQAPLSEIVRQFKTFSALRVKAWQNMQGVPVWQRNYYEHIIRNEESYAKITQYIIDNPARWEVDSLNPGKIP